jgi:hypothetical protein
VARKVTKLQDVELNEVSVVRRSANSGARIALRKSSDLFDRIWDASWDAIKSIVLQPIEGTAVGQLMYDALAKRAKRKVPPPPNDPEAVDDTEAGADPDDPEAVEETVAKSIAPLTAAMADAGAIAKSLSAALDAAAVADRVDRIDGLGDRERRDLVDLCKSLTAEQRDVAVAQVESAQVALAKAIGPLCDEIGHGGTYTGPDSALGDLVEKVQAVQQKLSKSGVKLSEHQITARIIKADPSIYRRYKAERRRAGLAVY